MSKTKQAPFEVVGHQQIEVAKLRKHPSAVIPIGAEDSAAMQSSIAETGHINQDLLVLADTLEVVDGCNRLDAAIACGMQKIWCKLIRTDNPRKIVLDSLSIGRSRTTGQRIMAFIEMHQDDVIQAYQEAKDAEEAARFDRGKKGTNTGLSRDNPANNPFHYQSIAEHLKVCHVDVLKAIQLTIETMDTLDEERNKAAKKIMQRVYAGQTPIRRALAGLAGKSADQHGRQSKDYPQMVQRAIASLGVILRSWEQLPLEEQQCLELHWKKFVVPHLPEDLLKLTR
jgi:hypothetical protein